MARVSLLLLAPFCLLVAAACDDRSGEQQIERMKAERARADPPQFWSMQVMNSRNDGRPVLICADSRIVAGFDTVAPSFGGQPCERRKPDGEQIATEHGWRYRCHLGAETYAVSTGVAGDRARDFLVSAGVHPMVADGPDYSRDMRFRRIGACPVGWKLGDATDQHGARHKAFNPEQD